MKAETKETAIEKIKEIRTGVAKDKASKVQDGKDRRRAGHGDQPAGEGEGHEKAGGRPSVRWEAPEEMVQVDYTHQEKEFADLVAGPDSTVYEDVPRESQPHPGRGGETAPQEAQNLVRKAQELADGPVLSKLQEASDDLYAWASTRVANDPEIPFETLMEEMVQFGLGELAAEAAYLLETHGGGPKAGNQARCRAGDTRWDTDGPGKAMVQIDEEPWAMWDYGEMVHMTEELAGLLGVIEPEKEKRQCVTKVFAAGLLMSQTGKAPGMEEVERLTQEFRLEQARLAVEAEGVMGHPEAKVAPVEHELRMYAHDILKPHHDKDYRALAVFPLAALEEVRIVVVRVDYKGDILLETVVGSQWTQQDVWVMISKGHMTLLHPPSEAVGKTLLAKEEVYHTPCLGFRYFWHQRHDQAKTAPGIIACRHCKPRKGGGSGADIPDTYGCLRKTTCLPALSQCMAGGPPMMKKINGAQGHEGLVLREYFAGHGVITRGWKEAGMVALEPIELYDQPHQQIGRRPDHDLADATCQKYYLDRLDQQESNVQWIASPCTTFCDWCLQNGGTRTFKNPAGLPTDKELIGNTLSEYGAKLFEKSMQQGGFPIAESSGTSGRYPKQWHLPAWRRLLQRPDVDFIEVDMCAFGLGPPDAEGQFYRHRTGLAFPHHPPLRQALLRLCPGVSATHQHVALKGSRPGVMVSRCTEAGAKLRAGRGRDPVSYLDGGGQNHNRSCRKPVEDDPTMGGMAGSSCMRRTRKMVRRHFQRGFSTSIGRSSSRWLAWRSRQSWGFGTAGPSTNQRKRSTSPWSLWKSQTKPWGSLMKWLSRQTREKVRLRTDETLRALKNRGQLIASCGQISGYAIAWRLTLKEAMSGCTRMSRGMTWLSLRSCPTPTGLIASTVRDIPGVREGIHWVDSRSRRSMTTGGPKDEAGLPLCRGQG